MSQPNPAGYFVVPVIGILIVLWIIGLVVRAFELIAINWSLVIGWPFVLFVFTALIYATIENLHKNQ